MVEYDLALQDSLALPAGYQLEALDSGSIVMMVPQGQSFVWAFSPGDTWPMDGNTVLKNSQTDLLHFRGANCQIRGGTVKAVQQAIDLVRYASDVCKP